MDRGNRTKDALDVLRLLSAVETAALAERLDRLLQYDLSQGVTAEVIDLLEPLFGTPDAAGVAMVVRSGGADVDPDVLALSMTTLVDDLLKRL